MSNINTQNLQSLLTANTRDAQSPLAASARNAQNPSTANTRDVKNTKDDSHIEQGNDGIVSNPGAELDKDAFLKLLLIELQHQDPTDPMDTEKMLTQTAQLSALEMQDNTNKTMTQLVGAMTKLQNSIAASTGMSALAAVGKLATVRDNYLIVADDDIQFQINMYLPKEPQKGNKTDVETKEFELKKNGEDKLDITGKVDKEVAKPGDTIHIKLKDDKGQEETVQAVVGEDQTFKILGHTPSVDIKTAKIDSAYKSDSAPVTFTIYNEAGDPVRTMSVKDMSAGMKQIVWDRTDDSGNPVPSGKYYVRASYVAEGGETVNSTYGAYPITGVKFEEGEALVGMGGSWVKWEDIKEITG
ncbi:flagellar hook assembly protein FlgD [Campylobacter volucris]|uniref:Basal-body rod modification protein FlgD n=1 Tax=Campylobacter volucris TaxID=1031542 RepID=A0AAE5YGU7_9BACT|nr:flagellar hook assembly protein FlgD [Campylobacter volucris]AJC94788.1 flagellar hook assembly protein [Campylobacter volucris LMG 24379]KAB0578225.1 flagellar hook assembly protein FlgD [Campylobacter volucris]QBL12868.1 flagellar hook assembly protein FlgD [Campylobacter volucris]QEL09005.1 flagellar hook assembly protein [Campylobacter volucris]TXK66949.1 flagellar hook assembly protein FlgD [Campylobacter volucris]